MITEEAVSSLSWEIVQEILARTSMPDLVERYVRLLPAANGRVWKGACPFHRDDGTSFYVFADGFHCFGCGIHGDAFEFGKRAQAVRHDNVMATLGTTDSLEQRSNQRPVEVLNQAQDADLTG